METKDKDKIQMPEPENAEIPTEEPEKAGLADEDIFINVSEIMHAKEEAHMHDLQTEQIGEVEESAESEEESAQEPQQIAESETAEAEETEQVAELSSYALDGIAGPRILNVVGPKYVSWATLTAPKSKKKKAKKKKQRTPYEEKTRGQQIFYNLMTVLAYCLLVFGSIAISLGIVRIAEVTTYEKQLERTKAGIEYNEVDLASALQSYTANQVIADQGIPTYTLDQIYAMDLRQPSGATEADLKLICTSGLTGLEDTFLAAEQQYGVNAVFLISIASLESARGTQMYRPNNMFGYGGKSYPSKEACIMDVAQGLSSRYLAPGGGLYGGSPTLKGVNKRYAANPQWYAKVGKYMNSYYSVISPYHNRMLDKIR